MKHNVINTGSYLLVVSDEQMKRHDENCLIEQNGILAHLPLNNSAILESVDLLPPLEQEDDVVKMADEYSVGYRCPATNDQEYCKHDIISAFNNGYNKAKEKYKYTKEQLIWAIQEAYGHGQNDEFDGVFHLAESIEVITKHLSQPKMPIVFEYETIFLKEEGTGTDLVWGRNVPKTTTNSQGQTQWVGKWIY